ncbi:MAG: methyltransferase domain-containing protein [Acidobacteriaceae bacterium]
MARTLKQIGTGLQRRWRIATNLKGPWYRRSIAAAVTGKRGLEIGGPSSVFSPHQPNRLLPPVYALAASVDNCNYAASTVWSKGAAGTTFEYLPGVPPGQQYIVDATGLGSIEDQTYDFILASHVLEHVANPLKALQEWRRVLKPGGYALVLLPNKAYTFDHRRPDTTFAHLQQDLENDVQDDDRTHLDEILSLHDLELDKPAGSKEHFRERSLRNIENRCLHHHVFSPRLLHQVLRSSGFDVMYLSLILPPHILAFARRRRLPHSAAS